MARRKSKTTKLTYDEVKHFAKLANLKLTPAEIKTFQKQLSEVLDYVEKLREVNTSNTEPTSQVTGLVNVFREDKVQPSLTQKKALSNAKRKYKGYFVTKSVF